MTGQLDNGTDGKGVRFAARLRALNHSGEVSVHGDVLRVRHADEVVLLIAAGTDYQGFAEAGKRRTRWLRLCMI